MGIGVLQGYLAHEITLQGYLAQKKTLQGYLAHKKRGFGDVRIALPFPVLLLLRLSRFLLLVAPTRVVVCENRIGAGPPQARTKVIHVELG